MEKKNKSLTLRQKILIIHESKNKTKNELCTKYGCSKSTINRIIQDERNILEKSSSFNNLNTKRIRNGACYEVEQSFGVWFQQMNGAGVTLSSNMLMEKAKEIAISMNKDFNPTSGWLWRWKKRHGVSLKKCSSDKLFDANSNADYKPDADISNGNESGSYLNTPSISTPAPIESQQQSRVKSNFEICRLCFKSSENPLSIFDKNEYDLSISNIINQHFWFELLPTDTISTVICCDCWIQVVRFHRFYESVEQAQRNIIPTAKIELETAWHEQVFLEEEETHHFRKLEEPDIDIVEEMEAADVEKSFHFELTNNIDTCKKEFTIADIETETTNFEPTKQKDDPIVKAAEVDPIKPIEESESETELIDEFPTQPASKTYDQNEVLDDKESDCDVDKKNDSTGKSTKTKIVKRPPYSEQDQQLIEKYIQMSCDLCVFSAVDFAALSQHFREMHVGIKPYVKCCDRKLNRVCKIVEHSQKHEDPGHFKCKECNKNFVNSSALRSHCLRQHAEENDLKYECDQCDKRFSRKKFLKLHKPSHIPVDEWKFICEKCPNTKAFASKHLLQIHNSFRHKKATNVCHVCAKEIRDNHVFEKHVRLHFEESGPRVKCLYLNCDRWLKDIDSLKQHMLRHVDEGKEFKCIQCGKCCKTRSALRSHMRYSHTDVTFNCDQCQKTFKKQISLKEHMAQHTGEPLYKCPFCPRTFNSNANMHSHKKKMHPVEWDVWRKTKQGSAQKLLPTTSLAASNIIIGRSTSDPQNSILNQN